LNENISIPTPTGSSQEPSGTVFETSSSQGSTQVGNSSSISSSFKLSDTTSNTTMTSNTTARTSTIFSSISQSNNLISSSGLKTGSVAGIISALLLLFLILVALGIWIVWKRKKQKKEESLPVTEMKLMNEYKLAPSILSESEDTKMVEEVNLVIKPDEEKPNKLDLWEIIFSEIQLGGILGEGAFGEF
jgi:hypothetical protein